MELRATPLLNRQQLNQLAGSLAALYRVQGRYGEAAQLFRKALLAFEKNLPRAKLDIPLCEANLMMALFWEAEALVESTLARAEKLVGPQHPIFATVLQSAAEMRTGQKRYGPAKQYLQHALGILEQFYGPDAPELRRSLEAYSAVLYTMKDKAQAKQSMREFASSRSRNEGVHSPFDQITRAGRA